MQVLNELIPVAIIAFALSMVSERLASFLKLYLPRLFSRYKDSDILLSTRWQLYLYVWANLHLKHEDKELESIREGIIMGITLCCGLLIAFVFAEDILHIIGTRQKARDVFYIIGFGILFSFGSKFWHDLLDLLLFTKNIRRRQQNINPEDFNTAQEVKEYLYASDKDLLIKAIEEHKQELSKRFPGKIKFISYKYTLDKKLEIIIYLEDDIVSSRLPKYLKIKGYKNPIPVRVIVGLGPIKAQAVPGDKLDLEGTSFWGTFGCLVQMDRDNEPYILTCGHNLTERNSRYDKDDIINNVRLKTDNDDEVRCHFIRLEKNYDLALLKVSSSNLHENKTPSLNNFNGSRILTEEDELNSSTIFISVNRLGGPEEIKCKVEKYAIPAEKSIEYDDDDLNFQYLIAIKSAYNPYAAPSEEGDSGAIAYDANGNIVGMVVGADNRLTYLQSFYRLSRFNHFNLFKD